MEQVVSGPSVKSPGLAPAFRAMEVNSSGAVPKLWRVTGMAALVVLMGVLGKSAASGIRVTEGALPVPVPNSGRDCVAGLALSTRVREAVRLPAAVGVKMMERMQVPAAGTGVCVEQVVPESSVKSPGFAPAAMV